MPYKAKPKRSPKRTRPRDAFALGGVALTAGLVLAEQGEWYGAAAALGVAVVLGAVGRREQARCSR